MTQEKKQLTTDRLEKLKAAREKALAVRQANASVKNEIKTLEKQARDKELEERLNHARSKLGAPLPSSTPPPPPKAQAAQAAQAPNKPQKKTKEEVIREVIDEPSSASSSEGEQDDDNDVIHPVKDYLKQKYKQKYKNKYEARTLNQLAKGAAATHLRSKVNDEIMKLASAHLFGGN